MEIEENWVEIEEFPRYEISDLGRIFNIGTEHELVYTPTQYGDLTVGLWEDDMQHRRSVKRLVAEHFVPGQTYLFDTPIQKNGDRTALWHYNLVWRPRWFAWKYVRQFHIPPEKLDKKYQQGPVRELRSNDVYLNIHVAALMNGLLIDDVYQSIMLPKATFPNEQTFTFVGEVHTIPFNMYPHDVIDFLYTNPL